MERFPYARTFILGFGFFGISIIWPLFNSLIPPMLEDLGLSALVVGFILTWDNIINMFVQPWVGSLSDHTRTRIGRRKPFLLLGAPVAALFFMLVPFVRENFFLIGIAILGTNIGMAVFRSPTVAYLGDLFRPDQRSKANGVINLMGGAGAAVALFGGGALYKIGVPLPFIVGSGVMLLSTGVVLLYIHEPDLGGDVPDQEKAPGLFENIRFIAAESNKNGIYLLAAIFFWFVGWNAMEAFFTIYARSVLAIEVGTATQMLTVFAASLLLFAIPSGLLATRIGRKPTILIGLSGMIVGAVLGFFIRNTTALLVILAMMGAFWAFVNINSLPMVYDLGGEERIGALTGLYYFSSSAAAITGPILGGWLIDLTSHSWLWVFSAVFLGLAAFSMTRIRSKETVQQG
jgi:maltose/moltooligosaccharide transporter